MKTTDALEALARTAIANDPRRNPHAGRKEHRAFDDAFASIIRILDPRIRYLTQRWGLRNHAEDALQAGRIGVHKALETFDPTVAKFTTHVAFRLQAQMKDLRFHLFKDERSDAVKVGAKTISAESLRAEDDTPLIQLIESDGAEELTESAAAATMAKRTLDALLDAFEDAETDLFLARRPKPDCAAVDAFRQTLKVMRRAYIMRAVEACSLEDVAASTGLGRDRVRLIESHVGQSLRMIAQRNERFAGNVLELSLGGRMADRKLMTLLPAVVRARRKGSLSPRLVAPLPLRTTATSRLSANGR